MSSKELNLKIILIGDSFVGKTTIINTYTENNFNDELCPTIGLENKVKIIDIRGFKAKIQIWDTAGQEKFNSLTQQFFRNTDGILLIFDLTNKSSFNNIKKWLSEVKTYTDHSIKKLLIGNKADMKDKIKVNKNDIDNFCKEKNNIKYMEISAKDNLNVSNVFETLINSIIGKRTNEELIADFGISDRTLSLSGSTFINVGGEDKKRCCK